MIMKFKGDSNTLTGFQLPAGLGDGETINLWVAVSDGADATEEEPFKVAVVVTDKFSTLNEDEIVNAVGETASTAVQEQMQKGRSTDALNMLKELG